MAIHMAYSTGRDILRIAKLKAEIDELVDMLEEMLYSNSTKYREKASELIAKHKGE